MAEKFTVNWEASDGYAGGRRPHSFTISSNDLSPDMTEDDLNDLFYAALQDDFEQHVSPYSEDEERFVEWAKEQISKMES